MAYIFYESDEFFPYKIFSKQNDIFQVNGGTQWNHQKICFRDRCINSQVHQPINLFCFFHTLHDMHLNPVLPKAKTFEWISCLCKLLFDRHDKKLCQKKVSVTKLSCEIFGLQETRLVRSEATLYSLQGYESFAVI